jgi:hypothetical protein
VQVEEDQKFLLLNAGCLLNQISENLGKQWSVYIWFGVGLKRIFTICRILVDAKTLNQDFIIKNVHGNGDN